jgi:hypothetical protein
MWRKRHMDLRSRSRRSGRRRRAASLAYEGGKVTGDDEGSVVVDDRLHLLAYVVDDIVTSRPALTK